MAVVTALNPGEAITISQTTSYALPSTVVWVCSTAAVEVSMVADTGFVALTSANTIGAATAALFVRCTGSATLIVAKKI